MSSGRPLPATAIGAARLSEVSENIYAYVQPDGSWWINNTGFLVGRRGVISVDACATEARTRAYLRAIAGVSDQPVRTLINTHHHGDHTFGNHLFGGATIVAHEGVRQALLEWGEPRSAPYWTDVDWGEVELAPPFLTYREGVTVHVDDLVCEVGHIGTPAHTTNDSVVWVPERKLLFSGDLLFNGGTPFLLQGSVSGALRAMGTLRALGAETIVPGHGPVCGPEVIDRVEGYLRFVREVARGGREAGLTPLEAARETDLGPYRDLLDPERIVGNLHRAYAELDGVAPGGPIDAAAALADMVRFNGGKPLSCHA
ncbi:MULTISPECIES: MBL fold metallo-hydrolase [Streptomyces]|uniref:Cyclase n=1 Tax=Streptomyces harbinensis TaxID=1176198 RepID=A0A1I6VNT1_9ACTN|nr:MBL fold metallo-hydrolase [Streptomyces harbinensis]QKV71837.1 MBL fold metallo-hydrolase [Streptomyces harbinensis]SFT15074.1 cyclase [Streptomyces harbinensis]